jgi:hypothetical protein
MSTAATPERILRMVQMACPAFVPGMLVPGFMKAISLRPVRWLMNTLPHNEAVGRRILHQMGHGASLDANRIPPIFFEWYLALQRHTNAMRNDGEMIGRAVSLRGVPPELTIPMMCSDQLRSRHCSCIGAIAGGGEGVLIGGPIGAGVGTAAAFITGKKDIRLPPETPLTFTLAGPVTINAKG